MILKESISYYVHNQSSVFCTFLDASKAFDRLHYCKLFKLLLEREVPAHVIRVLINLYTGNFVRVAWCGIMSDYFLAINGVKQGGVLSPVLFCLYIDGLLVALSKAGYGCFIGTNFVGALAYADDIVLLAPSAFALRKMLAICDNYATEYYISFNAKKSKCLVIFPSSKRFMYKHLEGCTFYVGNKPIEFVDSFSHLGHIITSRLDDSTDILKQRGNFIGQVNNMLCYFSKLKSFVKNRLFQSYCTSLYGCELWLLSTAEINDLCVTWRKSLRRVWDLPSISHTYLLHMLSQCLPLFEEICRRSCNFIYTCITNKSRLVRCVAQYGLIYARYNSFLGSNALFCAQRFNCHVGDVVDGHVDRIINKYVRDLVIDSQLRTAYFVEELINIRDNVSTLSNSVVFTRAEISDVIQLACTS